MYKPMSDLPSTINASSILKRLVQSLIFRFAHAVDGLNENDFLFRPTEESMSMHELLNHLYSLMRWSAASFDLKFDSVDRSDAKELIKGFMTISESLEHHLDKINDEDLKEVKIYLKREDKHYPFWFLINGPLADALTHIGQILTWRRTNGNPCKKVSPFTGKAY